MRSSIAVFLFASLAVADVVPMPTVIKPTTSVVPMPSVIFPTKPVEPTVIPLPTVIARDVKDSDDVVPMPTVIKPTGTLIPLPSVVKPTDPVVPLPSVIFPTPGPACTGGSFKACISSVMCLQAWPWSCYCERDNIIRCAVACRERFPELPQCPESDELPKGAN